MDLTQLYTRGTKLAEVDPHFRGMKYQEWLGYQISRMCSEHLARHAGEDPLYGRKISTPRDNYGWRSA